MADFDELKFAKKLYEKINHTNVRLLKDNENKWIYQYSTSLAQLLEDELKYAYIVLHFDDAQKVEVFLHKQLCSHWAIEDKEQCITSYLKEITTKLSCTVNLLKQLKEKEYLKIKKNMRDKEKEYLGYYYVDANSQCVIKDKILCNLLFEYYKNYISIDNETKFEELSKNDFEGLASLLSNP